LSFFFNPEIRVLFVLKRARARSFSQKKAPTDDDEDEERTDWFLFCDRGTEFRREFQSERAKRNSSVN
jgi:hypothetical protein